MVKLLKSAKAAFRKGRPKDDPLPTNPILGDFKPSSVRGRSAAESHELPNAPVKPSLDQDDPESLNSTGAVDKEGGHFPEKTTSPSLGSECSTGPNLPETTTETIKPTHEADYHTARGLSTDKRPLISKSSSSLEDRVAWLWNIAYDNLSKQSPELLSSYEQIVSSHITKDGLRDLASSSLSHISSDHNISIEADYEARQEMMNKCLAVFLMEPIHNNTEWSDGRDDSRSSVMHYDSIAHVKHDANTLRPFFAHVAYLTR
ncbi:hypothetical protein F5Y01DRAFT_322904 [Xylaria sp. FL0043]|nr:hypothetical protein F5Y01DRAFT_322904 [Xylaria sp. FL0043]